MRQYAGDPTNYPATVGLIDDSDTPNAANFDVLGEGVLDRTAWIHALVVKAINGVDGGTYTPSSPIIIDGTLRIGSGGTLDLASGSATSIEGNVAFMPGSGTSIVSGCTFQVLNGAVIDFLSGGEAHIESGATIVVASGGTIVAARGQDIHIGDGTYPTFDIHQARDIAQPIVCLNPTSLGTAFPTVTAEKIVDAASGGEFVMALPKLVNGSRLFNIKMHVSSTVHAAAATQATVTLYKADITTGTRTSLGSTTLDFSVVGPQDINVFPSSPETIDDSFQIYFLSIQPENGLGAQAITWFAPKLQHHEIATLGPI